MVHAVTGKGQTTENLSLHYQMLIRSNVQLRVNKKAIKIVTRNVLIVITFFLFTTCSYNFTA